VKILMLIPQLFYSARGTPLSAYHRIKDLIAMGHEVEVLTYGPGDAPPDLDIPVHRARGPHFARSIGQGPSLLKIWFDVLLFVAFVRLLASRRYDLVYTHEEAGFLAALVCPLLRVPFVYDMHSSLPLQIRDWGFSNLEAVVALFRFVERFTLKRARAVVAISPGVAAAAHASWPQARVVTILNRFALASKASAVEGRRLRQGLGLDPEHRVVLYAGTFVPLQALDLLVDAIPSVVARCPEARFVLVGGTKREIEALALQSERLGVRSALVLVEHRPQHEMPAFLAAADALISPRVKGINPPGKLFSYLDSGKPVVATDRPIHNQILDPSFSILTAPDAAGLAEGILTALTDCARVDGLTRNARAVLEDRYGTGERTRAYAELLRLVGG
jgi:glycosyltransferase involved in cell wall biosynthesis